MPLCSFILLVVVVLYETLHVCRMMSTPTPLSWQPKLLANISGSAVQNTIHFSGKFVPMSLNYIVWLYKQYIYLSKYSYCESGNKRQFLSQFVLYMHRMIFYRLMFRKTRKKLQFIYQTWMSVYHILKGTRNSDREL